MRSSVCGIMLATLVLAPVAAVSAPLSDAQFIEANRCLGLMTSKALATPDAASLKQRLDADAGGRAGYISDKADEARNDATRQAGHASADERAKLTAERDGVCRALLPGATVAGQPGRQG